VSTLPSPSESVTPTTEASVETTAAAVDESTDEPPAEPTDENVSENLASPITNAARFVEQLGRIAIEHGDSMDYSDFGVPAAWVEFGGWPARAFGSPTPTTIDSGAVRGSLEVDRPYLPYAVVDTTGRCAAGVVYLNRDQLDFLTGPAPVGAACDANEATTALAAEIDQ
jgi:hypothetical protein